LRRRTRWLIPKGRRAPPRIAARREPQAPLDRVVLESAALRAVRSRAAGFFYLPDARCLERDRSARRAALRDACRRMRFLRCCALLMDIFRLQQRAEALGQLSALTRQHSFSHTILWHPGEHRQKERPRNCGRRGQVGHGGTSLAAGITRWHRVKVGSSSPVEDGT
jgi:hypothetical protein